MMRRTFLILLAALAVSGCSAPPKIPQLLDPQFAARKVTRIAVAPVFFADDPLDRYFGTRAATEIRWHAQRTLQRKGYEVEVMENPYTLNVPKAPKGGDIARLAPPPPPGTDAVMVIRVDHFLDAGVTDRQMRSSLDIYATAALVALGGEVLWKDEGVGRGSSLPSPMNGGYDLAQAPAFLADSLFATLPTMN